MSSAISPEFYSNFLTPATTSLNGIFKEYPEGKDNTTRNLKLIAEWKPVVNHLATFCNKPAEIRKFVDWITSLASVIGFCSVSAFRDLENVDTLSTICEIVSSAHKESPNAVLARIIETIEKRLHVLLPTPHDAQQSAMIPVYTGIAGATAKVHAGAAAYGKPPSSYPGAMPFYTGSMPSYTGAGAGAMSRNSLLSYTPVLDPVQPKVPAYGAPIHVPESTVTAGGFGGGFGSGQLTSQQLTRMAMAAKVEEESENNSQLSTRLAHLEQTVLVRQQAFEHELYAKMAAEKAETSEEFRKTNLQTSLALKAADNAALAAAEAKEQAAEGAEKIQTLEASLKVSAEAHAAFVKGNAETADRNEKMFQQMMAMNASLNSKADQALANSNEAKKTAIVAQAKAARALPISQEAKKRAAAMAKAQATAAKAQATIKALAGGAEEEYEAEQEETEETIGAKRARNEDDGPDTFVEVPVGLRLPTSSWTTDMAVGRGRGVGRGIPRGKGKGKGAN